MLACCSAPSVFSSYVDTVGANDEPYVGTNVDGPDELVAGTAQQPVGEGKSGEDTIVRPSWPGLPKDASFRGGQDELLATDSKPTLLAGSGAADESSMQRVAKEDTNPEPAVRAHAVTLQTSEVEQEAKEAAATRSDGSAHHATPDAKRRRYATRKSTTMENVKQAASSAASSMRKSLSRAFTKRSRQMSRTSSNARSAEDLFEGIGEPAPPKNMDPLCQANLHGTSVARIRALIEEASPSLFESFLQDSIGCKDLSKTGWELVTKLGVKSQSMNYLMPSPPDVPDLAKKIVGMPDWLKGSTVTWFKSDADDKHMAVMQRCASEGALYTDRFHIEYTLTFDQQASGTVLVKEWLQVVWNKPLPWTHHFLAKILEHKVRGETIAKFSALVQLLAPSSDAASH